MSFILETKEKNKNINEEKNTNINEEIQNNKFNELDKENNLQEAIINIRNRFGKNSILKGTSYEEGATGKERNEQIGGHKS